MHKEDRDWGGFKIYTRWIIRPKLTPVASGDSFVFSGFSHVFSVTVRQILTPFKVAKWVAKCGAY